MAWAQRLQGEGEYAYLPPPAFGSFWRTLSEGDSKPRFVG